MMIEDDVMPFHVIEKGLAESHFGFVIKHFLLMVSYLSFYFVSSGKFLFSLRSLIIQSQLYLVGLK